MINIGRDYSRFPAGRYLEDGQSNGQRFREQFLLPVLKEGGRLKILFDDALGYGSSFLEEAFGGLVRSRLFSREDIDQRLELVTDDDSMKLEINQYIDEAFANLKKG